MTDEELDLARANEAYRLWSISKTPNNRRFPVSEIAARLAREGWISVDPLVLEAREICAKRADRVATALAAQYRAGRWDHTEVMLATLAGLKRGVEISRDGPGCSVRGKGV